MYLRVSFAAAEERGVLRDADALGGVEAARHLFRERYHAAQHRYINECDPESQADVVIDNNDPDSPRISSLGDPDLPNTVREA